MNPPYGAYTVEWGILGLLVGDALGVPYEFTKPKEIPPFEEIEYEPPKGFRRAHNVPPGTWSDDGAQALCVLEALHRGGDHDLVTTIADNLLAWRDQGYMAVDGHVFDIGHTTNGGLSRYKSGEHPIRSGLLGENTKSNGSLMRVLPIALTPMDDDSMVRAAISQSRITHRENEPQICCALYVLWARHVGNGSLDAWDLAFKDLLRIAPEKMGWKDTILAIKAWDGKPTGSGYVVDSLHSAREALEMSSDFESAVRFAIRFGNDTDTTAAIVGGLAGLKYRSIPERWIEDLRGKEILDPLFESLRKF